MKVSGFGSVPAIYDKDEGIILWAVKSKLRGSKYTVNLSFDEVGKEGKHFAAWSFLVDRNVFYLPDYEERVKAERLESVKVLENQSSLRPEK